MIFQAKTKTIYQAKRPLSYLDNHLYLLENGDSQASHFWRELSENRKRNIYTLCREIENSTICTNKELIPIGKSTHELTKRWFTRIQEEEFRYSRVRDDWSSLVKDPVYKQELWNQSSSRLNEWLEIYFPKKRIGIYGGIKSEKSIESKMAAPRAGTGPKGNLVDLWDVVRFRIVVTEIQDLVELGIAFWECFFDHIVRCRNYYYHPKQNLPTFPYRAIHFELADDLNNLVEVQLMTRYREAISLLDHPFAFKRILPFSSEAHEEWLHRLSIKANILEADRAARTMKNIQEFNILSIAPQNWATAYRFICLN